MTDMPNKDEVLADLPERVHVYDMDELENLAVAYDMKLLQTRVEWEATIDPCPGDDPTCPGHDHGDPCNYREETP